MSSQPVLRSAHSASQIQIYRAGLQAPLIAQIAESNKRPYIHPILAPDGVGVLTENAPAHHPWQHGLYVGLNDLNGVGFWTEGHGKADGTFHPQPLQPPTTNGNQATWKVISDWRSPDGTHLITEEQVWRVHDGGTYLEMDMDWRIEAAVDVTFGAYAYGGLFLRMPFRKESGGTVLTSEGLGLPEAEGQRARWIALSMPIEERHDEAGIAMFDHPANQAHPVPWRVDGQLGIAPSRCIAGAWSLEKGELTSSKYRLFVFCGGIHSDSIEEKWQRFAKHD